MDLNQALADSARVACTDHGPCRRDYSGGRGGDRSNAVIFLQETAIVLGTECIGLQNEITAELQRAASVPLPMPASNMGELIIIV